MNKYRCLKEVQSGMTKEFRPNEELWNEFYDVKNLHLSSPGSGIHHLISRSEVEYCTFTRALKYYIPLGDISIVAWPSSLKREAYGMGEELGHHLGRGTWFRHEGLAVTRWYNHHRIHPGRSYSFAVSLQRWHPAWQPAELHWGDVQEEGVGWKRCCLL